MPDSEKMKEKLGLYLSTLSESAQKLLLRTLEQESDGQNMDRATRLILAALKDVLKKNEPAVPLSVHVKKELFRPCAPFLADIDHVNKVEARISPASIEVIWTWICRDIASSEQKGRLEEACNDWDDNKIAAKTTQLCQELLPSITAFVNKMHRDPEGKQKLGNQLGGSLFYEDLMDILDCPSQLDCIKPTLLRFPPEVSSWSSPEGEEGYALISQWVQSHPMRASWAFSAISGRLSKPHLKLQLATKLAGSDDAVQVSATVYSPAVHQVMGDLEANLSLFEKSFQDIGNTKESLDYLSKWRRLAKSLETELELSPQGGWGKSLAEMKTKLSETLEHEIASAPGMVRKALRAPKDGHHEQADENLLQDAIRAVEIFHHVERMKDSLALNAEITRIRKELDQSFEILTTSLVERTRQASGADITACKLLGDAASVMARHVFDDDFASALRRQFRAASSLHDVKTEEARAVGA